MFPIMSFILGIFEKLTALVPISREMLLFVQKSADNFLRFCSHVVHGIITHIVKPNKYVATYQTKMQSLVQK